MICQTNHILTESAGDAAGFPWTHDAVGAETKSWLGGMLEAEPEKWVANAPTDLRVLRVGDLVLPVTVDTDTGERSYVVSPWAQYVAYAEEEADRLVNPWWRAGSLAALRGLRPLMRRPVMDRVVQVNNWLVSTNLWNPGMQGRVRGAVEFLRGLWPDRAIIFRSLDEQSQADLIRECREAGARMVFSRVVTWQDPRSVDFWRNRQLRVDRKRSVRNGWTFQVLGPGDVGSAPVLRRFYDALYRGKYSRLNPDFTEEFFREALRKGFVRMEMLLDADRVPAGCWGWWCRDGAMTQPIFGYDPGGKWGAEPYAALSLRVLEVARAEGLKVNASGGAGAFKQRRGGRAVIEWHAVFDAHLPLTDRVPWILLEKAVGRRAREWLLAAGL